MMAGLEQAVADAIGKADAAFGYSFNLTRLVDGIETHTLTMEGFGSVDFEDRDEGYALIASRRNAMRAAAVTAAIDSAATAMTEEAARAYFERGFMACYAWQYVAKGSELSDAVLDHAWEHRGEGGELPAPARPLTAVEQSWGDIECSGCTLPRRDCECN